jgi:hypothetical protein
MPVQDRCPVDAKGKRVIFLARWLTNKAMQHARDRIRDPTDRSRLLLAAAAIVTTVNRSRTRLWPRADVMATRRGFGIERRSPNDHEVRVLLSRLPMPGATAGSVDPADVAGAGNPGQGHRSCNDRCYLTRSTTTYRDHLQGCGPGTRPYGEAGV